LSSKRLPRTCIAKKSTMPIYLLSQYLDCTTEKTHIGPPSTVTSPMFKVSTRVHLKASFGAPETNTAFLGAPSPILLYNKIYLKCRRPKSSPLKMLIQSVQPFSRLRQPPCHLTNNPCRGSDLEDLGGITPHFIATGCPAQTLSSSIHPTEHLHHG
jgi:hypothetical protein